MCAITFTNLVIDGVMELAYRASVVAKIGGTHKWLRMFQLGRKAAAARNG